MHRRLSLALLAIGGIIAIAFVGVFKFQYPELTQTQVLLERWPYFIVSFFFLLVGYGMLRYGWGRRAIDAKMEVEDEA